MSEQMREELPTVVDEKVVLEKIDDASGQIVERVYVHNGDIVQHDFFEDGELVSSQTYGGDE